MNDTRISRVDGLWVWDSRGRPTVEATVYLQDGSLGRAIAPAGASTGSGEATDLRDGGAEFGGYGVAKAVRHIQTVISKTLRGLDAAEQAVIDTALIRLDGTQDRSYLGGNAMIAASMATAHALAASCNQPLWQRLAGDAASYVLPVPEVQIFGGGAHAQAQIDLQDFMVVPFGASSFREAIEWVAEIYACAASELDRTGRRCGVADEGGFWPCFNSNEEAIESLANCVRKAGFDQHNQVGLSIDVAATQFYRDGAYHLRRDHQILSPDQWLSQIESWANRYQLLMIEDPFVEDDLQRHAALMAVLPGTQIVGDDLLVTNVAQIHDAAAANSCNTLLCKPNQAGTLTEARQAFDAAKSLGWNTVISARSGETEDTTIVDLAVGWGIEQLKVGSFTRSERMAKWNAALRIEAALGSSSRYAGRDVLRAQT